MSRSASTAPNTLDPSRRREWSRCLSGSRRGCRQCRRGAPVFAAAFAAVFDRRLRRHSALPFAARSAARAGCGIPRGAGAAIPIVPSGFGARRPRSTHAVAGVVAVTAGHEHQPDRRHPGSGRDRRGRAQRRHLRGLRSGSVAGFVGAVGDSDHATPRGNTPTSRPSRSGCSSRGQSARPAWIAAGTAATSSPLPRRCDWTALGLVPGRAGRRRCGRAGGCGAVTWLPRSATAAPPVAGRRAGVGPGADRLAAWLSCGSRHDRNAEACSGPHAVRLKSAQVS